jgi:hypothetical protein
MVSAQWEEALSPLSRHDGYGYSRGVGGSLADSVASAPRAAGAELETGPGSPDSECRTSGICRTCPAALACARAPLPCGPADACVAATATGGAAFLMCTTTRWLGVELTDSGGKK